MSKKTGIYERIEKSSLGTSQARAARRSVTSAKAAKIVARASRLQAARQPRSDQPGG